MLLLLVTELFLVSSEINAITFLFSMFSSCILHVQFWVTVTVETLTYKIMAYQLLLCGVFISLKLSNIISKLLFGILKVFVVYMAVLFWVTFITKTNHHHLKTIFYWVYHISSFLCLINNLHFWLYICQNIWPW